MLMIFGILQFVFAVFQCSILWLPLTCTPVKDKEHEQKKEEKKEKKKEKKKQKEAIEASQQQMIGM